MPAIFPKAGLQKSWRWERPSRWLRPPPKDDSRDLYEIRQSAEARERARFAAVAGQDAAARAWWERAFRFTPGDPNLACMLARARLGAGDIEGALALFTRLADRHDVREVLLGQAAAAWLTGDMPVTRAALQRALSGFAADPAVQDMAARYAAREGGGWCGVTAASALLLPIDPAPHVSLDGRKVALPPDHVVPPAWRHAARLRVRVGGADVLGSPINLTALYRTEGFVARERGRVVGWVWHPGMPEIDPVLVVEQNGEARRLTVTDTDVEVPGTTPLMRPRAIRLKIAGDGPVHVRDANGRDLWGSPVARPGAPPAAPRARKSQAVTVVIPVYRGHDVTLACIRAVRDTIDPRDRIVVVNDASPEPALVAALTKLAAVGVITLIDSDPAGAGRNQGFPTAANAGLRAANGTDIVLLNSDTLVFPGWLGRLRAAAYAAPAIGTATPLSNDASIFSYPDAQMPAPMPLPAEGAALDALAATANVGVLVEVPTGHGFCLFIRAACLHAVGLLRQDVFAQGYGEENDFCERARAQGWRHVAVPSVYVAHQGGASFGAARTSLLARNAAILDQLHPSYHRRVAAFIAADGLAASRRRIDMARWRAGHARSALGAMLLVSHGGVGGTTRVVAERAAAARANGLMPVVIGADDGFTTVDAEAGFPNLRFALPRETALLADLLAACRPSAAELHNLLGHGDAVMRLILDLGVSYDAWVHDWGWICSRVALVTPEGRFCGEPPVRDCAACESRGEAPAIATPTAALRPRNAALLGGARRVIVATEDAAQRLRRYFPNLTPTVTPWETDGPRLAPPAKPARLGKPDGDGWLTVAVVGAIGLEKGHTVLVDCARDAAARNLKLRYAVIGYTTDDDPLLATEHVTVTGRFAPGEVAGLIANSGAAFAFLPSIWPETWCYALSDVWEAGLRAVVFDIGAPAERVRQTGAGWVLPLGLAPPAINDVLLRLQSLASRSVA